MTSGPVLIDLEDQKPASPEKVPAVPDTVEHPDGAAMQKVAALATRRTSPLARWFWTVLLSLLGFIISLAAWDYVTGLMARSVIFGTIATLLLGALLLILVIVAMRELASFARLRRLDLIQHQAADALENKNLKTAQAVTTQLETLYRTREDIAWGLSRLQEKKAEILDADGLLGFAETTLLAPLDARASREVEAAARQVATVTAIVPLALADVFAALTANLRMIRRIAEVYGGRTGALGNWRLTRTVFTHLVATGAVAVGDDLIGSVAGGGVLSKVSRRFGEGIVNGALTARVGIAAIEVCRPLAFRNEKRPTVSGLVRRALTGLFGFD
ncbi:YcjF family protein [Yoonia sp. 2307UL14-13]|uniref:YcjF family protein n=1 Tax=Yoonia sp. 2307UL14-13 TaxID=3126506 RepID=UPI0030AFCCD5